ncbi:MAG: hypothetical protein ABR987_22960, partial [Terracidiphilus sp.]
MPISSKMTVTKRAAWRLLLCFTGLYCITLASAGAQGRATCTDPTATRPILFVPGIFESSDAWGSEPLWTSTMPPVPMGIRDYVMKDLEQLPNSAYANPNNYELYYDGAVVRVSSSQEANADDPIALSDNIPCDARFFSIRFFGWSSDETKEFEPFTVANVSVVTKAYELSQVLKVITQLTYVQDVVVVAHSMGALDSRAYMEGLGSTQAPCTAIPCEIAASPLPYTGEIGMLVTLDGANAGSDWAYFAAFLNNTNVVELEPNVLIPGWSLIQALNYQDSYSGVYANDLQGSIAAIVSTFRDTQSGCLLSNDTCGDDKVLESDSQSIEKPLQNHPTSATLQDLSNTYLYWDLDMLGNAACNYDLGGSAGPPVPGVLHLLSCLSYPHQHEDQYPASIIYSAVVSHLQSRLTSVTISTTDSSGNPYTGSITLSLQVTDGDSLTSVPITEPQT